MRIREDFDSLNVMTGGDVSPSGTAGRNHATMFFTVAPKPDIDDVSALEAYGYAQRYLASLPDLAPEESGYRLFWAKGEHVGHRDLAVNDHAIIGRHSACDVALPMAAELSLRHLLVAITRLPPSDQITLPEGQIQSDAAFGLRVLDLRASLPFYTDDGQPRRSIVATGTLVLRLGTYLFGGVPLRANEPKPLLPEEMPRSLVTTAASNEEPSANSGAPSEQSTIGADEDDYFDPPPVAAPPPPPAKADPSPLRSRVTVVPPTALLTEVVRSGQTSAYARLTVLRDGHSASMELPASDLDAGVLIGRSERCADGGLRRVLDGNISRIHVLLLREGDDIITFDLCSTQGTYHDGRPIRRHKLSAAGGCLSLAKTNPVMLCLHARNVDASHPSAVPRNVDASHPSAVPRDGRDATHGPKKFP